MGRKYVCDNCGEEFEKEEKIVELLAVNYEEGIDNEDLGEFCYACLDTVRKFIKEGFAKGKA